MIDFIITWERAPPALKGREVLLLGLRREVYVVETMCTAKPCDGRPNRLAGGRKGPINAHSATVRSLAWRRSERS